MIPFTGFIPWDPITCLCSKLIHQPSGCYIWVLEFMPEKYRNYYNSYSMMLWTAGYPVVVTLGYTIKQWNYIHIGYIGVFALCFIPFTFFPDSPSRFIAILRVLGVFRCFYHKPTIYITFFRPNSRLSMETRIIAV
eukprot:sb/3474583/